MARNILIDITHPPFGHEKTFAALYVASASLSKGLEVVVVLRADGVYTALAGQENPMENIHLPPTEQQIEDVIELDGRVIVNKECLDERGIDASELIEGIEIMDSDALHSIILDEGEAVITF